MTGRGLCDGVTVTAIKEVGALINEQLEPARDQMLAEALEIIAAKLIDRDDQNE
jgi:hypothetical protein